MKLLDILLIGWYYILSKTTYLNRIEYEGIGPKEHSFFVIFLLHGINATTLIRYFLATKYNINLGLYVNLAVALLIFVIGYLMYFKEDRINRIVSQDTKGVKIAFFITIALLYTFLSVYIMIKVGDHLRYQFNQA